MINPKTLNIWLGLEATVPVKTLDLTVEYAFQLKAYI